MVVWKTWKGGGEMTLKGYRAWKNIKLKDIAGELKISTNAYLNKEKTGKFFLDEAFKTADMLGISIEEFRKAVHESIHT